LSRAISLDGVSGNSAINARFRAENIASQLDKVGNLVSLTFEQLVPFPDNPFKLYSEDRLMELAESIEEQGLINPVVVRLIGEGKYQILSGHNRVAACRLIGKEPIPCRVLLQIDDDTAAIIVTNSNLRQREVMLPSEKAKAYRILMDARISIGKSGVTVVDGEKEEHSYPENRRQVFRYLRLNHLTPGLLALVDSDRIPFFSGVALSYLQEENQKYVEEILNTHPTYSLTVTKAEALKTQSGSGKKLLDTEDVRSVLASANEILTSILPHTPPPSRRLDTEVTSSDYSGRQPTYITFINDLKRNAILSRIQKKEMLAFVRQEMAAEEERIVRQFLERLGKTEASEDMLQRRYALSMPEDDVTQE